MESKTPREILSQWFLASGCFAVLVFFFSPPFGAYLLWTRVPEMQGMLEVRRGASVLLQVAHPGTAIPDPLHGAIRWRLLFPVAGHLLHLPPAAFFALAPLGCLLALAFIVAVLRRHGLGFLETALAALILGATSWFFTSVSWLGYFDSWLVLALLFTAFARASWPVWLACLWAPWVDERFVLAAPLALICRHAYLSTRAAPAGAVPGVVSYWKRDLMVSSALLAAFVVIRLGFLAGPPGSATTIRGYFTTQDTLRVPWARIAFGMWSGLRVAWLPVAAAVWLSRPRRAHALWIGAAILAVMAAGVLTAQDLSRSMMMVLPAALLGVLLAKEASLRCLHWALPCGAAAALLLPAHHVMSDRVNPIFYLYHEIAALENPPAVAMPELRVLRGILEEEQGNFGGAEADFTLAIRLGGHPSMALKQRGVLYASQRRWQEARQDFSSLIADEPGEPDGWFLRAQSDLALGDVPEAQTDLQQALAVGSPEWLKRPDVAAFAERMNRRAGRP